jgi:hypothetical protein
VVKSEDGPREELETLLVEASSLCDDVMRVLGGERERATKSGLTDAANDVGAWDAFTRCLKNEILVRTLHTHRTHAHTHTRARLFSGQSCMV